MKRYTPEEDAFLIGTHATLRVAEQAAQLGRSYSSVIERRSLLLRDGHLDMSERAFRRLWSEDDKVLLELMLGRGSSMKVIAQKLRRSRIAIYSYLAWQQDNVARYRAGVHTAAGVARLFGVHGPAVRRWIRCKWLRARRGSSRTKPRYSITDDDIRALIECRESWVAWSPARIIDRDWREYAEEVRARAGGRWVATADIARARHFGSDAIRRRYRHGQMDLPDVCYGRRRYYWQEARHG